MKKLFSYAVVFIIGVTVTICTYQYQSQDITYHLSNNSCKVKGLNTISVLHTSNSDNTLTKFSQTIDIDCTKIE